MTIASIISNAGIIIWTTDAFELEEEREKWLAFLIIEHALFLVVYFVAYIIPDTPLLVSNAI